jgi:hypothetical protein
MPSPFMLLKLITLTSDSCWVISDVMCFTIDFASGCSLLNSHPLAISYKFYGVIYFWSSGTGTLNFFAKSIRSLTRGCPWVNVPVLSNTTIVTLYIFSKTEPPSFSKTPKLAAIPVPTMTAVGVASPKAHGHAITNVAIPKLKANSNSVFCCSSNVP